MSHYFFGAVGFFFLNRLIVKMLQKHENFYQLCNVYMILTMNNNSKKRSCSMFSLSPSLTQMAIVVVLDELAVVDRSDPELPLHGGNQGRALEQRSGQRGHRSLHLPPSLIRVATHRAV